LNLSHPQVTFSRGCEPDVQPTLLRCSLQPSPSQGEPWGTMCHPLSWGKWCLSFSKGPLRVLCLLCAGLIRTLHGAGEIDPVAGPPGPSLEHRGNPPGCFPGLVKVRGWFLGGRQISSPSLHPATSPGNMSQRWVLLLPHHPPALPGKPGVAAELP